jgi:hypothetical protein
VGKEENGHRRRPEKAPLRLTVGRAANSRSAASHTYMFRDRRSLTPGIYRRRSAAEVPTYNRIDFHGATPPASRFRTAPPRLATDDDTRSLCQTKVCGVQQPRGGAGRHSAATVADLVIRATL